MTKRDLIDEVNKRFPHLSRRDSEVIINAIFDSMVDALAGGDRIEIRGFGSFVVKNRRGDVVFQGVLADGQAHLSRGLAPLHVMAVDGGVIRLGAPGHKPALMGDPAERSRQAVAASAAD